MPGAFKISAIDLHGASLERLLSLFRLSQVSNREYVPEREPAPFNEAAWRLTSAQRKRFDWVVEDAAGEAIAHGNMSFGLFETNRHLAGAGAYVHPDHRRRGIGTALLAEAIAEVRRNGRTLITFGTGDQVPAGETFLVKAGAEMALENRINRLDLEGLDPSMLDRMIAVGEAKGRDFTLGWWIDTLPEDEMEAVATLFDAMNAIPRGKLKVEDHHVTPAQLREGLRNMALARTSFWNLHVREKATGTLAGFSEVFWHPDRPALLWQGNTGVLEAYRGHGLGRWMKATMLKRVLTERPTVKIVETANADSNAPMLKINTELGFRLYSINRNWQLAV